MITGFFFSIVFYILPLIIMWIASYIWLHDLEPDDDLGILLGVMLIMVALIPVLNAIFAIAVTLKFLITKILQKENKQKLNKF